MKPVAPVIVTFIACSPPHGACGNPSVGTMLQGFIRTRHLVPHPSMRAWNRAKLLWGYLARRSLLSAQPVEYIVETTAKCNLYCPMCPRETHKQPKEDMTDEVFNRLVEESGRSAEHMMLIELGEPFMD